MMNKIINHVKRLRNKLYIPSIRVIPNNKCVDFIIKNHCSVIRLGDGEFDLIGGKSIPYQIYDKSLSEELRNIALTKSNSQLLICIPDVFKDIDRYKKSTKNWYFDNFYYQNRKLLKEIYNTGNWYGSTFLSRPYIDLKDKKNAGLYFDNLKKIWTNKDVLIVEGFYTRSGEGNDLFKNARSIQRIVCPSKNAYTKLGVIEKAIKAYGKNKIVLLMLGPTSKVIVNDMYKNSMQLIDLGHIDSEYEWFKMGVYEKTKIPGKHTAEFNNDDDKVELKSDKSYDKQVVAYIN